jgi:hypothetical protein
MTHITSCLLRHDECAFLSLSLCPQTKQRAKVDLSLETFWFFDSCKWLESLRSHTTSSKLPQWKQTLGYRAPFKREKIK